MKHTHAFLRLALLAGLAAIPAISAPAIDSSRSVARGLRHWNPSDEIEIDEVAEGVFVVLDKTPIPSNSLVAFGRDGSCLFVDTPWTPEATETLIEWVTNTMGSVPASVGINTHFHRDRLGGNATLKKYGVRLYGGDKTLALLKEKDPSAVPPDNTFQTQIGVTLDFDGEPVLVWYPGPGHTKDNVVVWLPKRGVLFGGCFVKSLDATDKGNVADADLVHWADSLAALKAQFPDAKVVIPGHGAPGGMELIDHTIDIVR